MGKNVNGSLHILILDTNMAHCAFEIIDKAIPH